MFRTYLSGSMGGRSVDAVRQERAIAISKLAKAGIFAVDPAASEKKLWGRKTKSKITLQFPESIINAFVIQDLWLIRRCDALIVMTGDTPSDGTWWEMAYAKMIGIPVIMVAPQRATKSLIGWSNIQVTDIVEDLDHAVRLIKRKYVKEYLEHRQYFDTAIKNAETAFGSGRKRRNQKERMRKKRIKRRKTKVRRRKIKRRKTRKRK